MNCDKQTTYCAKRVLILLGQNTGIPSGCACPEGARLPPTQTMDGFIDGHKELHRGEPICKVLPTAPSTYYDHVVKRIDPARQSARVKRDTVIKSKISSVFNRNYRAGSVYLNSFAHCRGCKAKRRYGKAQIREGRTKLFKCGSGMVGQTGHCHPKPRP